MMNLEKKQLFFQLKENNGVIEVEASDNDDAIENIKNKQIKIKISLMFLKKKSLHQK